MIVAKWYDKYVDLNGTKYDVVKNEKCEYAWHEPKSGLYDAFKPESFWVSLNTSQNPIGDIIKNKVPADWTYGTIHFGANTSITTNDIFNIYEDEIGPTEECTKQYPKNNDGLNECAWCNAPTKLVQGFTSCYNICTKCGK